MEDLTVEQRRRLERLAASRRKIDAVDRDAILAALATIDRQAERIRELEATQATERQYRVYMSASSDSNRFPAKSTDVPSLDVARIEATRERKWLIEPPSVDATVEIQTRMVGPWSKVEEGGDDAVQP